MAYDLQDFETQVLQRSQEVPVLVDFWSPHCGPCLMFAPILEDMAERAQGKWDLVKINTMDHPELASRHEVSSIPDIRIFYQGEQVEQFLGMRGEDEVERFLKKYIASPYAEKLTEARKLLESKAFEKAAAVLESLEDQDEDVCFLLAQAYLSTAPEKVATTIEPIPLGSEYLDKANALAELADWIQKADDLPKGSMQGRYLEGIEALRQQDFGPAFEAFIDVLREEPKYAESGAAEICKLLVRYLGLRDPIADKYQRIFSSLLYS